jgi:hypothetical protein
MKHCKLQQWERLKVCTIRLIMLAYVMYGLQWSPHGLCWGVLNLVAVPHWSASSTWSFPVHRNRRTATIAPSNAHSASHDLRSAGRHECHLNRRTTCPVLSAQPLRGAPVLPVGLQRADLLYDDCLLLLELLVICTRHATWLVQETKYSHSSMTPVATDVKACQRNSVVRRCSRAFDMLHSGFLQCWKHALVSLWKSFR